MLKAASLGVLALVTVTGCALPPEGGRVPTSPQECRAQYDQARARGRVYQPPQQTRGGLIGNAIGKGIASGMIEQRYKRCLTDLGVAPSGIIPATAVPQPAQSRPHRPAVQSAAPHPNNASTCALEMVGGTGYVCQR